MECYKIPNAIIGHYIIFMDRIPGVDARNIS